MTNPTQHVPPARRMFSRVALGLLACATIAASSLSVAPALAAPSIPVAPVINTGGTGTTGVAVSASGAREYSVTVDGSVYASSTSTDTVLSRLDTTGPPPAPNGFITGAAISPDGTTLYAPVYNTYRGTALLRFDLTTNTLAAFTPIAGAGRTGAIAISPDATTLVVRAELSPSIDPAAFVIDLTSGLTKTVTLGSGSTSNSSAVTFSPDSSRAYVTGPNGTVARIDLHTASLDQSITLGGLPSGLALTANGDTLYVANSNGSISTVDTSTGAVSAFITGTGLGFSGLALTPNGASLVALDMDSQSVGDAARIYSIATRALSATFLTGAGPQSIALTPDGTKAYVGNSRDSTTSVVPLVERAPLLTADTAPASATVGKAYSAQFTASGYPAPTYSATGTLPTGLTLNPTTGLLSGKPTAGGTFSFQIVASNGTLPDAVGATHSVKVLKMLKTSTPTISGTKKVGKKLTAKKSSWGPSPVSYKYQWYRATKGKWSKISGATKSTYKLASANKGHQVRVTLTGSKSGYLTVTKTSKAYTIK